MKAIKIDAAYPDFGTMQLSEALENGWYVFDRIPVDNRYVTYILRERADPDVGKSGTPLSASGERV